MKHKKKYDNTLVIGSNRVKFKYKGTMITIDKILTNTHESNDIYRKRRIEEYLSQENRLTNKRYGKVIARIVAARKRASQTLHGDRGNSVDHFKSQLLTNIRYVNESKRLGKADLARLTPIVGHVRITMQNIKTKYVTEKTISVDSYLDMDFFKDNLGSMFRGLCREIRGSTRKYKKAENLDVPLRVLYNDRVIGITTYENIRGNADTDRSVYFTMQGSMSKGYVNVVPNQILKLFRERRANILKKCKLPRDADRHVSVEAECFVRSGYVENDYIRMLPIFDELGITRCITAKYDSSINGVPNGFSSVEFVITCKQSEYVDIITKACKAFSLMGARINSTCGLHVHLDMRHYSDLNMAYNRLLSVQPILFTMQPKSRQDNAYCKRIQNTLNEFHKASNANCRYYGINAKAFRRHKTIELRMHSGTVDARKIINFVELLIHVTYNDSVTESMLPARGIRALKTLAKLYSGISDNLLEYIKERMDRFKDANQEEIDIAI